MRRTDYASRDFYDAWLPELAPSAQLLSWFRHRQPLPEKDWDVFAKRYRAEMQAPEPQHLLGVFAALSATSDFSIGCYCERAERCHRTILAELLRARGAIMQDDAAGPP